MWSRTTKHAACASTDHGGGKRRGVVAAVSIAAIVDLRVGVYSAVMPHLGFSRDRLFGSGSAYWDHTAACVRLFGFDPSAAGHGLIGLSNTYAKKGPERAKHRGTSTRRFDFRTDERHRASEAHPEISVGETVEDAISGSAKCWSEWQDLNLRPPRPERGRVRVPSCIFKRFCLVCRRMFAI